MVALLATMIPAIAATATSAAMETTECDTTATSGPEPRHPYIGRDGAAALGQAGAHSYGNYPYVYTLFVPEALPDGPVPLLIGLHGLGSSAQDMESKGLMELAAREGFIVALPSGRRSWWASEDSLDVKFIRDVVADVRAERCVDGHRIWAMGQSNGAVMAHRLACDAADLFAAVSVHAGKEDRVYPLAGPCRASDDQGAGVEPTPIRFSHGTMDPTVDYEAGRSALRNWIDRYRCDTNPIEVRPTDFGPTEAYGNCQRADVQAREAATGQRFELVFHTLDNHGHLLPDGCGGFNTECEAPGSEFPTADDINTEMYAFFSRNPRPSPAPEQPALDIGATPTGDPVRLGNWAAEVRGFGPHTELVLVGEDGAPITTAEAIRERTIRVELAVFAPANHPDEVLDNHPRCPSTTPGSRKIRIVGRHVTLQVTDARSAEVYVAETVEQSGTGLAVATFPIPKTHGRPVLVEATTDLDRAASPLLCTTAAARFQETLGAKWASAGATGP